MRKAGIAMTVAITDQARMFGLTAAVSELFRDGKRNPRDVLDVMQTIKEHADFMAVLRGAAKPNLRYDKRRDGWTLREHSARRIVSAADFEPVPFLRPDERSIKGYDLIGRARYELDANLGQEDAEFLLEHEQEIPEEFRPFYFVFTATVWWSPGGGLGVSCLSFRGERWCLLWYWLGHGYVSRGRLLRPGK